MKRRVWFICGLVCLALAAALLAEEPAEQPKPQEEVESGWGLRGEYYDTENLTDLKLTRLDPVVNFDWGGGSPHPWVQPDTFSVRWVGKVLPKFTETYTFRTETDDGARLWVGDKQLVDSWDAGGGFEGNVDLEAGKKYDIKMEYRDMGGGASARLYWNSKSQPREIIPAVALFCQLPAVGRIALADKEEVPKCSVYLLPGGEDWAPRKLVGPGAAEPAVCPDGALIAFTSGRHTSWTDPKTVKNTEIYVMNGDGTGQRRVTTDPAGDKQPAFSADGRLLAYVSNRRLNWDIYVKNVQAGAEKPVTTDKADDLHPTFSPDGTHIVFQSSRDGVWNIYLMNIDGSDVQQLTKEGGRTPVFSPDGKRIAFVSDRDGNPEIYLMDPDGTNVARLTQNDARDECPAFSPTGQEIAFLSDRNLEWMAVYLMTADGKDVRRVTKEGNWHSLSWSW